MEFRQPNIKQGNCFLHSLLVLLLNPTRTRLKLIIRKSSQGFVLPSCHAIVDKKLEILYRRRPKGNGSTAWFKGRAQVIPLNRMK